MANMFKEAAEKSRLSAKVKEEVVQEAEASGESSEMKTTHHSKSQAQIPNNSFPLSPDLNPEDLGLVSAEQRLAQVLELQKDSFPIARQNTPSGKKNAMTINGRPTSIYLDDDIAIMIDKIAASIGSSRSKTINQILRNALSKKDT